MLDIKFIREHPDLVREGWTELNTLAALNATAADISRQLRQVQQEASGGRTDLGGSEQSVRTIATVASAQDRVIREILGDMLAPRPMNRLVQGDVVVVGDLLAQRGVPGE